VRVLDPATRVPYTASEYECNLLQADSNNPPTLYHAAEARSGNAQGYHGRIGIYELVTIDDELRRMIHDGAGEHELEAYARQHSPSIRREGLQKAEQGVTTLEEVLRVTRAD
jgi:general secretion pathway protein E